jgi:hypothetical protein
MDTEADPLVGFLDRCDRDIAGISCFGLGMESIRPTLSA